MVVDVVRVLVRVGGVEQRTRAVEALTAWLTNNPYDFRVVDVVQVPTGVAVIGDNFWTALQGKKALQVEWDLGENVLVDIAKLGTVFLFFQARDSRFGMAKRLSDGGWKYETVDDTNDIERIKNLFDSLKKQIRQGYFELPNPLRK